MKEMCAISASVGVHCQPCLTFHVSKARELGIGEGEIKAAVEVDYMVEKGASNTMREHAWLVLHQVQSQGSGCCSDRKSKCCD